VLLWALALSEVMAVNVLAGGKYIRIAYPSVSHLGKETVHYAVRAADRERCYPRATQVVLYQRSNGYVGSTAEDIARHEVWRSGAMPVDSCPRE